MSVPRPSPERVKREREGDTPATTIPGTPNMKIDFKDNDAAERVITITHSSSSNSDSFTFTSSTASGLTVKCGKLRIHISNDEDAAEPLAPIRHLQAAPIHYTQTATPTPASISQPRNIAPSPTAKRPVAAGPKPGSAVARSNASQSGTGKVNSKASVTVYVRDYKQSRTTLQADRTTRVGELIQLYAAMKGLDARKMRLVAMPGQVNIRFYHQFGGEKCLPETRLGSIVKRHFSSIGFNVKSSEDPNYDPFSDYESDVDKPKNAKRSRRS